MICPSRSYHFKIFKVCLPQILLYPFLNTLTHINTKPRGNGNSEYWIYSKFVMLNFAIHILQQMQQIFLLMFYKNLTFRLKTIYRIVCLLCVKRVSQLKLFQLMRAVFQRTENIWCFARFLGTICTI